MVSAPAWDGRNRLWVWFLAVSDIYPMFIEPTITWVLSGFSGYIWLDKKIVLKKKYADLDGSTDCSDFIRRYRREKFSWWEIILELLLKQRDFRAPSTRNHLGKTDLLTSELYLLPLYKFLYFCISYESSWPEQKVYHATQLGSLKFIFC